MSKNLNGKTAGFWLNIIACCLAIIGALGLILTDRGDITFSWITVALMTGGIAFGALNWLTELSIAPLLSAICIGCGFSWHLFKGLPTLSDIWNGVNFIGGNANAVIVWGIFFFLATILAVISSFMHQRKLIQVI